ncbi:energy-coupling factor transporter transmembrane component T [Olsenella sp. An293]|uniref:energy-coupling factor transporter transmembrane component T family protein n=1 Tax=Olsenella sp. An293 TaxID=1965626 RepID=UPI001302D86C|nr:energy-coupling factor transporter transmembrane component T [Olsenella sp. An293]
MRGVAGYVWADSPLHRASAAAKLAGLVACVALVVLATTPLELAVAAGGVAALVALSRVGWRAAARAAWGLRWFLLMVLALNALLFSDVDPIFSLGPAHLTCEGLAQGVRIVVRTLLVIVLGTLLTATTRPQELVEGVRRLLRPLGRIGLPTEAAALAVGVTVQFVPTLLRESRQLMRAQEIRCGNVATLGIMRRAVSYIRLLVPIFVSAVRRADELSVAMEARGYRLSSPRASADGKERKLRP